MSQPSTANGGFPSVVVTAVTATTSISPDIESTWKGLLAGESGIHALEDEFVTKWDLAVKIGGHLKDPVDSHMGRLDMRRMSYVQRMGKLLGGQLWESAGSPEVDPDRFAVVVGTGLGGAERIVESYDLMNAGGPRKVSPLAVQMIMPNGAAAVIGLQLGARAGVMTPVSACSSGSEAIAHAWRQIVMGDADVAVCGGVEGPIEALPIAAFSMMRAMSTRNDEPERASRPFDKDRDGFVFGEAGALMLIETEEHAKARGAKPLARLLGAGITSDAFHMVAPAADGVRAGRAMTRSLEIVALHTDVMRPLADAGPTLIETLDAYLDCGGAIEACARKLFVHPNTVRYRLKRITDFTGRDPTQPRDAYVLRVAATVGQLNYPTPH